MLHKWLGCTIRAIAPSNEPLHRLTRAKETWKWSRQEQKAFDAIKASLCKNITTAYFDPLKRTSIIVDGSVHGLCAIMTQPDDVDQLRVISYASRATTEVESRYSQTEIETRALVFVCERFHGYIFGVEFDLLTHHRALVHIFNNRNIKLPARLEQLSLRLQPYTFLIKFASGSANAADFLSRHPANDGINDRTATITDTEDYVNFMTDMAIPPCKDFEGNFRTRQQVMRHFNRSQN